MLLLSYFLTIFFKKQTKTNKNLAYSQPIGWKDLYIRPKKLDILCPYFTTRKCIFMSAHLRMYVCAAV